MTPGGPSEEPGPEPHPFAAIDLERQARRLVENEQRRERRRLALLRPEARAEYDRATAALEPPFDASIEDWIAAIIIPLRLEHAPLDIAAARAALHWHLANTDCSNLAERVQLVGMPAELLERAVDHLADELDDDAA